MQIFDLKHLEELPEDKSQIEGGSASVGVGVSAWANGDDLAWIYANTSTLAESSVNSGSIALGIGYTWGVAYTLPSLPYPLTGASLW